MHERVTRSPLSIYEEHLAKGELAYQYSLAADRPFFFPRIVCPYSGTDRYEWRISVGLGTVYTRTRSYPRDRESFAVVLVDLDEGFRMMSRVVDAAADEVEIGARVQLSVRPAPNGDPAPFFVLTDRA
jgi:uncharacterized OB-fold protein